MVEAKRIVSTASERGVVLRLLGGIAFRLRSPSCQLANLTRQYRDIDIIGPGKQRREINRLFTDLGYIPRTTFNAMNGHIRLIYNDLENERRADVFLDVFEMCHKFDFAKRLQLGDLTLPLADLLLTKLQVYEITEREYKDMTAMLRDHELCSSDKEADSINAEYIAKLCSGDWGLWRTVNLNLSRLEESLPRLFPSQENDQRNIATKINQLKKAIEDEPKSFGWKMRARVGDKVKWYELPEADSEVVDSRPMNERTQETTPTLGK